MRSYPAVNPIVIGSMLPSLRLIWEGHRYICFVEWYGGSDLSVCGLGGVSHRGERVLRFPAASEVKQAVHRSSPPFNISCFLTYSSVLQDASAGVIPTPLATGDVGQLGRSSVPPDSRDGEQGSPDAACRFCRLHPVASSLAYNGPTKVVSSFTRAPGHYKVE